MRLPNFGPAANVLGPGPFRIYTMSNFVSLIGTWMQRISVGYLTWELTHSATWLGLMALADLCPTLIVGPFAGVLADRWSRHRILVVTQLLGLAQASILALLYRTGLLDIILLFLITMVLGVINAMAQPARLAMVSSMVPRDHLASAVAVNAISFNLARFAGPAGAGVLIATAGMTWSFIANALSYAVFVVGLSLLPQNIRDKPATPQKKFGHDMAEGLSYALRTRGVLAVLVVMIVTGICSRPLIELLPAFASRIFGGGASTLAALTSSIGVGAVVGGSWISVRAKGGSKTRTMLLTSLFGALGVAVFTLTENLYLAIPIIAFVGTCWTSTSICAQTLLQLGAPEHMRGRVLALYGLLLKAAPAIGAFVVGLISDALGLRTTVAAGAMMVIVHLALQYRFRHVISDELENDGMQN